ncbi:MAG: iron-sulfur cluster assembly scaffold protein [Bacilli bacterium]|nr:iron-sulfur cluster assembly scaffold protein [Bacilli bacterium]
MSNKEDTFTKKISEMCCVAKGCDHGPAPIPEEGEWVKVKKIEQISALSHGIGSCAPQQGTCKLTLNVKNGIILEALIETIGCSGMTHSAAMAAEILQGKTILEALNTDLVCDAINVAMREIFKQLVYGRSQTAFSKNGLPIGSSLEDLGGVLRSQIGTMFSSTKTGARYLEITDGYVLDMAIDKNNEIIGYKFVNLGKMMKNIKAGIDYKEAFEKAIGYYGRYKDGYKYIDPRKE